MSAHYLLNLLNEFGKKVCRFLLLLIFDLNGSLLFIMLTFFVAFTCYGRFCNSVSH